MGFNHKIEDIQNRLTVKKLTKYNPTKLIITENNYTVITL